jgi:GntR family transcriptional repressor for pyruvate dehydrogenase complex
MSSGTDHKFRLETVFIPLSDSGRVEAVAQRIASAVHLGLLADGEQLPSEAELASQLGVSTVTLREALIDLRGQGIIETRRGRNGGSFARRSHQSHKDILTDRLGRLTGAEWRDLGDEQMAIDSAAAYLAAERATEEDLSRLHAVAKMLAGARTPAEKFQADTRFHLTLAVASQSERLTRATVQIQSQTADVLWLPNLNGLDSTAFSSDHLNIVAAIEREDSEEACRLARAHALAGARRIRELHLLTVVDDTERR